MNLKYLAECIVQAVTNIDNDEAVVIIEGLLKHSVFDPAQAMAKLDVMMQTSGKAKPVMITIPLDGGGEATIAISSIIRVWGGDNTNSGRSSIAISTSEGNGLIQCSKPSSFIVGLMREAGYEVYAERPINLAKS